MKLGGIKNGDLLFLFLIGTFFLFLHFFLTIENDFVWIWNYKNLPYSYQYVYIDNFLQILSPTESCQSFSHAGFFWQVEHLLATQMASYPVINNLIGNIGLMSNKSIQITKTPPSRSMSYMTPGIMAGSSKEKTCISLDLNYIAFKLENQPDKRFYKRGCDSFLKKGK